MRSSGAEVVDVGAGLRFECKSHEGAVLYLPEGAQRKTALVNKIFCDYIRKNFASWYDLIAKLHLTGLITPTDIVLVKGWVKCPRCQMAAFREAASGGDAYLEGGFATVQAGLHLTIAEHNGMLQDVNEGPERSSLPSPSQSHPSDSVSLSRSTSEWDQCISVDYFKVKWRVNRIPLWIKAAAGPAHLPDAPDDEASFAVPSRSLEEGDAEIVAASDESTVSLLILNQCSNPFHVIGSPRPHADRHNTRLYTPGMYVFIPLSH